MTSHRLRCTFPPIEGRWYRVRYHAPTRQLRLEAKRSTFLFYAPLFAACDPAGGRDVHRSLSAFRWSRRRGARVLTFTERSSAWQRKEYTYEFGPERIVCRYRVFGRGVIDRAAFFRARIGDPRTVEDELGVVPGFDTVFSPAANFMGKRYHFPGETAHVVVGNDPTYWGSGSAGAPCCFAMNERNDRLWVWAGLASRPGQHTYERFTWNANASRRTYGSGGFDVDYAGRETVEGVWASPDLVIGASSDPYAALADHVALLRRDYGLPTPSWRGAPAWWRSPIFCGWGEQMSLAFREHGNFDGVSNEVYCTQARHDGWLARLRRHGIRPGQVIVDAGWQRAGTTGDLVADEARWPDLRGWIQARRLEGLRTLLWMCAWNREGVPDDECITDAEGRPVNVDPTHPDYERRLRAMVRRLVSDAPGCYGADGVKVDGLTGCPMGPGLHNRGNLWGFELQRRLLGVIHDEVKRHKPDAVVGTFVAHPYLADLTDVARCGDLFSIRAAPADEMRHRARVLAIAHGPDCPIDADHAFWYDQTDDWTGIFRHQLACGLTPSLYHAQWVWHKRPFAAPWLEQMTDACYDAIRRAFGTQWRRIGSPRKARRTS